MFQLIATPNYNTCLFLCFILWMIMTAARGSCNGRGGIQVSGRVMGIDSRPGSCSGRGGIKISGRVMTFNSPRVLMVEGLYKYLVGSHCKKEEGRRIAWGDDVGTIRQPPGLMIGRGAIQISGRVMLRTYSPPLTVVPRRRREVTWRNKL
jgi:hypothetical protein